MLHHSKIVGLTGLILLATSAPGIALTQDQARENCRSTIGRPFVRNCVRSGGDRDTCRAQSTPRVRACVASALNAAHGRANVPVALPTQGSTPIGIDALPAGFVAPPRSIADITAILDFEKPDPKKYKSYRKKLTRAPSQTFLAKILHRSRPALLRRNRSLSVRSGVLGKNISIRQRRAVFWRLAI